MRHEPRRPIGDVERAVELMGGNALLARTHQALVQRLGDARPARAALRGLARPAEIPLSYAQRRRLWFLDRLEGASATYTIPLALRVRGVLDRAALEAAVGDLVERHESLRTIFPDTLGVPRQLILDAVAARPRLAMTCGRSGAFGSVVCCDAHRV